MARHGVRAGPQRSQQRAYAGEDCRLCANQAGQVALPQRHLSVFGESQGRSPFAFHALAGGHAIRELAAPVDPTGAEQGVRQRDQPGAAHAANPATADDGELHHAVSALMDAPSTAPRSARMPQRIPPPSKAGPALQAQARAKSAPPKHDLAIGPQVHIEGHGVRALGRRHGASGAAAVLDWSESGRDSLVERAVRSRRARPPPRCRRHPSARGGHGVDGCAYRARPAELRSVDGGKASASGAEGTRRMPEGSAASSKWIMVAFPHHVSADSAGWPPRRSSTKLRRE